MQVVATLSLKGGVGKTTVALGLAGAALHHGIPTLLVDLDPQANATIALDVEPTTGTVADVLDEPSRSVLRRAIATSAWVGYCVRTWSHDFAWTTTAKTAAVRTMPTPIAASICQKCRQNGESLRRPVAVGWSTRACMATTSANALVLRRAGTAGQSRTSRFATRVTLRAAPPARAVQSRC